MPHYPHLIDCRTLGSVPDIVVFDCRFNLADPDWGERAYHEGHLPGARFADLDRDLSSPVGPTSGRHPLPDAAGLARKLGSWGVDRSVQVAVYDDAGGAFAVRLWWLLRWLGHPAVALLDGGLQAWSAMGGEVTAVLPQPQPRCFEPQVNDAAWVSSAEPRTGVSCRQANCRRAASFRADHSRKCRAPCTPAHRGPAGPLRRPTGRVRVFLGAAPRSAAGTRPGPRGNAHSR